MIYMGKKTNENVEAVLSILKDAQIDYSPLNYYYTPIPPYPRSITPKAKEPLNVDLSDFQVMVYIHIPFCSRKCTFCPFFLDVNQKVPEVFVSALKKQIRQTYTNFQLPSKLNIYFGGGSPNLLSIDQLKEIIDCFKKEQIEEINIEIHPEVYKNNKEYFAEISKLGINRVSIGLQSTEVEILKNSTRGHDALTLKKIIPEIKKNNLLVNVDVMFGGLFGEIIDYTKNTFEYAFGELKPDWITAYQVCIHGGTAEKNRYEKNIEKYPDTKTILEMRAIRQKIAQKNGYKYLFGDYFSAEHLNPKYKTKRWSLKTAVIGLGPGAHSYIIDQKQKFGFNWYSSFNVEEYLNLVNSNKYPTERLTKLNKEHIDSWRIISQLKSSGFVEKADSNVILSKLSKLNLLTQENNLFKLTERGVLIEDLIYAVLIPLEMWSKLSTKKKDKNYSPEDAKYDWFFDPDVVIQFKKYLNSL